MMFQTYFISGMCFMVDVSEMPNVAPSYIIKAKVTIFVLKIHTRILEFEYNLGCWEIKLMPKTVRWPG